MWRMPYHLLIKKLGHHNIMMLNSTVEPVSNFFWERINLQIL